MNENRKAFLDMIAGSEGTARIGNQEGAKVVMGGSTLTLRREAMNIPAIIFRAIPQKLFGK